MTLPTTIQEVIQQLEDIINDCKKNKMREGYFASLYLQVTKEVNRKIIEKYFDDNERMETLDVVFANRYLFAYAQYKQQQPCSTCWQIAFDACNRWTPLVMQHLLEGMNAHIGLDLGIATASVCPGASIHGLQNDFNKINTILASMVNTEEKELSEIWAILKPIDWLAGKLNEKIAIFSMDIARDAAWNIAMQYAALHTADEQNSFITLRDAKVSSFGKMIIAPGITTSLLINCLRIFEHGSIENKIDVFNTNS